jgi:hypothetical protein
MKTHSNLIPINKSLRYCYDCVVYLNLFHALLMTILLNANVIFETFEEKFVNLFRDDLNEL